MDIEEIIQEIKDDKINTGVPNIVQLKYFSTSIKIKCTHRNKTKKYYYYLLQKYDVLTWQLKIVNRQHKYKMYVLVTYIFIEKIDFKITKIKVSTLNTINI